MIDEELAREAIGLLGAAAAMLIEDSHMDLLSRSTDIEAARDKAAVLLRIGTDIAALGAAATVLARPT